MEYILVQNRSIIHLGPISWKPRYIQSEINTLIEDVELSIQFQVPPVEQGYINIGDGFEIFPIHLTHLSFDHTFEHLSGPFWTYDNEIAIGEFKIIDQPIHEIQNKLKHIMELECERRKLLDQNIDLSVGTIQIKIDQVSRSHYLTLFHSMTTDSINYKSNIGYIALSKDDLQKIISMVHNYVQSCIDWEIDTIKRIDDANSIEDLKNIEKEVFQDVKNAKQS